MKTYEEGFIAGFSHNIKTVEELENKNKHLNEKLTSVRKEAAKLSKENEKLEERLKQAAEKLQNDINYPELCDGWEVMRILRGEPLE